MSRSIEKAQHGEGIEAQTEFNQSPATTARDRAPLQGLLWAEWFAHSKLFLFSLFAWLAGMWTLPFFTHPGWILLLGAVYALLAGPAYGGSDVLDGSEEFSFALPATRGERYYARMLVGGGTLLFFATINIIALGLDLPQVLIRLYVETGLIEPLPTLQPRLLSGLIVAVPFALFAFSFALSSITHSRWIILTAWLWSALTTLGCLRLGLWYEDVVWDRFTGFFACPLLLVAGVAALWSGYRGYQQKEVGQPSAPIVLPIRFWLWLAAFAIGLVLALSMIASVTKHFSRIVGNGL